MEDFSLLYPSGKKTDCQTLSEDTINSLSLDTILDYISESEAEKKTLRRMMMNLECDPAVIRYRCDIFDDLMNYPELREKLKDMLEQLDFLSSVKKNYQDDTDTPLWQLIDRLQELEVYVKCISGLNQALADTNVKSAGLKQMKKYVSSVFNESGFDQLSADINDMVSETAEIRSVSLGVNLDSRLRPVEVGIVSINRDRFWRTGIFSRFFKFASKKNELLGGSSFDGMAKMHTVGTSAEDSPLMNNLRRVVSEMLGSTVKHLKTKLSRYVNISGYGLTKLIPDLLFYIRWTEFCTKVRNTGLPVSKPMILDIGRKTLKSKGIYDIKLALQILKGKNIDIITNDFEFTDNHGIYIMTGPNRGGKTTFTQAVGLLFLLAQHGIYVPAESLSLSPCDNILTHFPADENQTVNLGRLGEESKRLSEIFATATDKSLLLFNESLATTSFTEGLYIAKDVVKALRFLGARTIFNTHMHELAMELDTMNSLEGDLRVASLITGIHEGQRSYKVFIAPPEGVSYARDIAEKYGVSFTQLRDSISCKTQMKNSA